MKALVTGGAGFFGEAMVRQLCREGYQVSIFDLNGLDIPADLNVVQHRGDVRRPDDLVPAMVGVDVVFHNVAQVPLARNSALFFAVNREGTRNALLAARGAGVRKFVYTSSSAVFGIPERNPVTEDTPPRPLEDYGRAKLGGEALCRELADGAFETCVIRPRTILGAGRLGLFSILFDWVARGHRIPVLDGGRNIYQFVDAEDLARACVLASLRGTSRVYNVGTDRFGSLADTLGALCRHADTGSSLLSLPRRPLEWAMTLASRLRLTPLAPYHALMYGRSLYFDVSRARDELGWMPRYSNEETICRSYDSYLKARNQTGQSPHRSVLKQGLLQMVPWVLQFL